MTNWHFYEPAQGHRLPHDPFKAIVAPRPIGWISTVDQHGCVNLAPYSFFNAICEQPPIVAFSSFGRKDTQQNIEETGEFVVNLATRRLGPAVNLSSAAVPAEVNEMQLAGLEAATCRLVKPPRVARSPAALECRLAHIWPVCDAGARPTSNTLIVGEVVGVHIDPDCLKDGLFDMTIAGTIARCGDRGDFAEVTAIFEMVRPQERDAGIA